MENVRNFNNRQFHLMEDICRLYLDADNSLQLWTTISQLEGLIGALQDVPQIFKNHLLAQWGLLEEIYAASLSSPELNLLELHKSDIRQAISNIQKDAIAQRQSSS